MSFPPRVVAHAVRATPARVTGAVVKANATVNSLTARVRQEAAQKRAEEREAAAKQRRRRAGGGRPVDPFPLKTVKPRRMAMKQPPKPPQPALQPQYPLHDRYHAPKLQAPVPKPVFPEGDAAHGLGMVSPVSGVLRAADRARVQLHHQVAASYNAKDVVVGNGLKLDSSPPARRGRVAKTAPPPEAQPKRTVPKPVQVVSSATATLDVSTAMARLRVERPQLPKEAEDAVKYGREQPMFGTPFESVVEEASVDRFRRMAAVVEEFHEREAAEEAAEAAAAEAAEVAAPFASLPTAPTKPSAAVAPTALPLRNEASQPTPPASSSHRRQQRRELPDSAGAPSQSPQLHPWTPRLDAAGGAPWSPSPTPQRRPASRPSPAHDGSPALNLSKLLLNIEDAQKALEAVMSWAAHKPQRADARAGSRKPTSTTKSSTEFDAFLRSISHTQTDDVTHFYDIPEVKRWQLCEAQAEVVQECHYAALLGEQLATMKPSSRRRPGLESKLLQHQTNAIRLRSTIAQMLAGSS